MWRNRNARRAHRAPVVHNGLAYSKQRLSLESLEQRAMLSISPIGTNTDPTPPPLFNSSPAEQAALVAFHGPDLVGKDGPMVKVGWDLTLLFQEHKLHNQTNPGTAFQPTNPLLQVNNDRVVVDVIATDGTVAAMRGTLTAMGAQITAQAGSLLSAKLPIVAIDDLAAVNLLRFARPAYKPITRAGSVTSQGDVALKADISRALNGVDGTGITVGVVSDSYDTSGVGSAAQDIATGDLVPVNVVAEQANGTDEGRAMLQIVHDVAPGANLAFATAGNSEAEFANNILRLAQAGSDVIVDDIGMLTEPFFQDGLISQAIDTVAAAGVAFFSAEGNDGTNSYESPFVPSGLGIVGGGEVHDFDPGPGVDVLQQITLPFFTGATIVLQWDEPFGSLGGPGSASDIDVSLVGADGTTFLARLTNQNIGGDPIEIISLFNPGIDLNGDNLPDDTFNLVFEHVGGPAPGLMKYIYFGTMGLDEYATNSDATWGHPNALGAAGVAASAFYLTPSFGVNPPQLNDFSSLGGITIHFDTAGNRLPTPEVRRNPRFTGPDGGNTTFFGDDIVQDADNFPNFYGTSASSPHVAAVAALMLQAAGGPGSLLPADLFDRMEAASIEINERIDAFNFPTSTPVPIPGDTGYDFFSGAGLVDASLVVQREPNVSIGDVTLPEGDSGFTSFNFPVTLSETTSVPVSVEYTVVPGSASPPFDYQAASGVLTFEPGTTSQVISVLVRGDTLFEGDETFMVVLSNPQRVRIIDNRGIGRIINDDDPIPAIYVSDVTVTQDGSGTRSAVFSVALAHTVRKGVSVNYTTADGSALAGTDYIAQSGTLSFGPDARTLTVTVPLIGPLYDDPKHFFLNVTQPTNAVVGDGQGMATIFYGESDNAIVIDDGDGASTSTRNWTTVTNLVTYQQDYRLAQAGSGSERVTWKFDGLEPGQYQILACWVPFRDWATNSPFLIQDDLTSKGVVTVNQRLAPDDVIADGMAWESLGTYTITSDTLRVTLSNKANGTVLADAIRIVRGGSRLPFAEVDVLGIGQSIPNNSNAPTPANGTDFGAIAALNGSATRSFTIKNQGNGALDLSGTPRVQISGANAADFKVSVQPAASVAPGGSTDFQIVFDPQTPGLSTATVTILNSDSNEGVYSFTIQGLGLEGGSAETIIDDVDNGFTLAGRWDTFPNTFAYGQSYVLSERGSGADKATWTFADLSPGQYQVFAHWVPFSSWATNAPYSVYDNTALKGTAFVNQRLFPNDITAHDKNWESLGVFGINSTTLKVVLSDNANASVNADAIRIVRIDVPPASVAQSFTSQFTRTSDSTLEIRNVTAESSTSSGSTGSSSAGTLPAVDIIPVLRPLSSSKAGEEAEASDEALASADFLDELAVGILL